MRAAAAAAGAAPQLSADARVLAAALALTAGWQRTSDAVYVDDVAAIAGVHRDVARRTLARLAAAGVIDWRTRRGRQQRSLLSLPLAPAGELEDDHQELEPDAAPQPSTSLRKADHSGPVSEPSSDLTKADHSGPVFAAKSGPQWSGHTDMGTTPIRVGGNARAGTAPDRPPTMDAPPELLAVVGGPLWAELAPSSQRLALEAWERAPERVRVAAHGLEACEHPAGAFVYRLRRAAHGAEVSRQAEAAKEARRTDAALELAKRLAAESPSLAVVGDDLDHYYPSLDRRERAAILESVRGLICGGAEA